MTYNEMKAALEAGICEVVFTKVDGTERKMECTRNREMIQSTAVFESTGKDTVVDETRVIAYDLNANGFRSFRTDSVLIFNGVKQ